MAEYLESDDQDSRWSAALAAAHLKLVRKPLILQRLRPLLTDENGFVRAAALRAVSGGASAPPLLDAIRSNLEHSDPKVRYEAAHALAALTGSTPPDTQPSVEPVLATRRLAAPAGSLLEPGDYQRVAKTIGARLSMLTSIGDFEIELDYDQAPVTADQLPPASFAGCLGCKCLRSRAA